jgi:hypothetical protein
LKKLLSYPNRNYLVNLFFYTQKNIQNKYINESNDIYKYNGGINNGKNNFFNYNINNNRNNNNINYNNYNNNNNNNINNNNNNIYNNNLYFQALKKCFGNKLRSKTLGLRHIDKGIYIDQIIRWIGNFDNLNNYLFISFKDFSKNTKKIYKKILKFLNVNDDEKILKNISFNIKKLKNMNKKCHNLINNEVGVEHVNNSVFNKEKVLVEKIKFQNYKKMLENFYEPYNELLKIFIDFDV